MRELNPTISRALDEVVMRALAKDGARRYQTAAEFAGDLRKAVVHPRGGFVAYPVSREEQERQREEKRRQDARRKRRLRRASFFAAIAVGMAIVGTLVWYFAAVYNMESVPLTIGSEEAAATGVISQRGFVPVVEYAYSEEYPQGLVLEQSVNAGEKRRRGTEISITVSAGSQWVYLEDMTGSPAWASPENTFPSPTPSATNPSAASPARRPRRATSPARRTSSSSSAPSQWRCRS